MKCKRKLMKFWYLTWPKKALLCPVTNQSFIVWSERVTELKVMEGTFQTEIAFSFVSKMKVVVTSLYFVHLILSNICFCTFSLKRNIKNLPWQTMTREVQTQDWEIYRNQHPKEEKKKLTSKRGNVDYQYMFQLMFRFLSLNKFDTFIIVVLFAKS